jgi:hypothetical protein
MSDARMEPKAAPRKKLLGQVAAAEMRRYQVESYT